jgi:hypothetical protein
MIVILTVQLGRGSASFKATVNFDHGTTRSQVYNWALGQTGLDRMSQDEYVVTFFYAEPDEVAA